MTDLDNFKSMNDTYGHMVGDAVLQNFADTLQMYSKDDDILCRLGGNEFVAFFTDVTNLNEASDKAAGVIKTFAEKMGAMGYAGIVSVSIGAKIAESGETFETLYSDADDTLYFVKENGKNSYHFWSKEGVVADIQLQAIDTDAELEDIHRMISEEQGQDKGAFHVEYDDFKKLYDFSMRTVGRSNRDVQTLLFTLSSGGTNTEVAMDDIMDILKQAVITSLRSVDTGTKYSCSQYIVLLMDTDMENGRTVALRVLEKFNQNEKVKASGVKASFDIQPLKAK